MKEGQMITYRLYGSIWKGIITQVYISAMGHQCIELTDGTRLKVADVEYVYED